MIKRLYSIKCPCGWTGFNDALKHKGSVTNADDWWECPKCGCDGSEVTFDKIDKFDKFVEDMIRKSREPIDFTVEFTFEDGYKKKMTRQEMMDSEDDEQAKDEAEHGKIIAEGLVKL